MSAYANLQDRDGHCSPAVDPKAPSTSTSSFVFTSSKIGRHLRNIVIAPVSPASLQDTNAPSLAISCVLTPDQVHAHALGAAHALPTSSSFRQCDANQHRPSPVRAIPILSEPSRLDSHSRPTLGYRATGMSLYLEGVETLRESSMDLRPKNWSTYSEPRTKPTSFASSPQPLHASPAIWGALIPFLPFSSELEEALRSFSSASQDEDDKASSYFTCKTQTSTSMLLSSHLPSPFQI